MSKFLSCVFVLIFFKLHIECQTISDIRFLSNSSIFPGQRDGIVIAVLETGEETTICNYKFTEIEACVVCKSLGYPANGVSIVNSKQYTKTKVLLGNFQCLGNESHLKYCVNSGRKEYSNLCGEHKMDVHVYCQDDKVVIQETNQPTVCKNKDEISLQTIPGSVNTGFLQLRMNGKMNYVCNDDFSFDLKAASYYCKEMCRNEKNPRPLMFLNRGLFKIKRNSSFVKTSCDKYPCITTVIEKCDPSFVVGLKCGEEPIVIEKSPKILCNHENMTVTWKNDTFPYINSSLVDLSPICNNMTKVDTLNGDLVITLRIGDCNPQIKDEKEHISVTYNFLRSYLPVGITKKNTANLLAQCRILKRSEVTSKILFKAITVASLKSFAKVSVGIKLFVDGSFKKEMDMTDKVEFNDLLFIKVFIKKAPQNIKLNLYNCLVSADDKFSPSKSIFLVQNMCPKEEYDVQITYLNRSEIGFQFRPFNFNSTLNMPIYVKCETRKCYFPDDQYCGVCNPNSRVKRDLSKHTKTMDVILGPIGKLNSS